MRPSPVKGGSGFIFGCAAVALLVLLSVVGFGYAIAELLWWAEARGVPAGEVVIGLVLVALFYSIRQAGKGKR